MTMLRNEEMDRRFKYHRPTSEVIEMHEDVRKMIRQIAEDLDEALPDAAGREKALVFTKIEEVQMWAHAAIARENNAAEEAKNDGMV